MQRHPSRRARDAEDSAEAAGAAAGVVDSISVAEESAKRSTQASKKHKASVSTADATASVENQGADDREGDAEAEMEMEDEDAGLYQMPKGGHFLGIQPMGNLMFAERRLKTSWSDNKRDDAEAKRVETGENAKEEDDGDDDKYELLNCREEGLGRLSILDDQSLLDRFFRCFDGVDLARMASVSRAFYGFIYGADVDLWRPLVISRYGGNFTFAYWWRSTYAQEHALRLCHTRAAAAAATSKQATKGEVAEILVKRRPEMPFRLFNFYSDELYQPWYCAAAVLANEDLWSGEYNIAREDGRVLTIEQFIERYATPCKPVVITNVVDTWPVWTQGLWTSEQLRKGSSEGSASANASADEKTTTSTPSMDGEDDLESIKAALISGNLNSTILKPGQTIPGTCGSTEYACGIVDMTIDKYLTYAERVTHEESPLYLFDKKFGEKSPHLLSHYRVPEYFSRDFYSWLPETVPIKPSFRWWLIGPAKSGSSFHKDPLYTHAWNGLVSGRKKWIMYPPHITPPGVLTSPDHLEVAAPISVAEWYLNFYHETKLKPRHIKNKAPSSSSTDGSHAEYDPVTDWPRKCSSYEHYKPVEIIQKPGEIVFIPSQWWHTALNFEYSVAITQNILSDSNFVDGMRFLTKIKQHNLRKEVEAEVDHREPILRARLEEREKELIAKMHGKTRGSVHGEAGAQHAGTSEGGEKKEARTRVMMSNGLAALFTSKQQQQPQVSSCPSSTSSSCEGVPISSLSKPATTTTAIATALAPTPAHVTASASAIAASGSGGGGFRFGFKKPV